MVDVTEIRDANILLTEKQGIEQTIANLDSNGKIVAMTTMGGNHPDEDGMSGLNRQSSATISTDYIETPPQMNTAIKQALQARQQQIADRLAAMGVTV